MAAAALLLARVPAAADEGAAEWSARYTVRFGSGARGVPRADVEARLRWLGPPRRRPATLTVGMADDGFPKGYGAFVRAFRDTGPRATGAPPAPGASGGYVLTVSAGGAVSFAYSVVLEHDASGWGPGPDEAPYRFDTGVFWTGRALFVTAPRSRAEVTFTPPAGDRFFTSFAPGKRARTYVVPDDQRLRDSFLVVGRPAAARLSVGPARIELVMGGGLEASLPLVKDSLAQFLEAAAALFGGAPPARILVVGTAGGRHGSFDGGVFGDDVSLRVDEPFGAANASRWRPFLAHELFHLWNGRALDYEGQQYWISEGFTDYYARVLLARLGQQPAPDFVADLEGRAARVLSGRADVGLLAAGDAKFENTALVYDGGMLAALCLDLQVRAASGNRRSLDDVMRALYAGHAGPPPRPVAPGAVLAALAAAAGAPFDDFFARHVSGHEPLPLAASLALAGVELEQTSRDLLPLGWVTATLLRCPSLNAEPGVGLRVLKSRGEALRAGDVIVAVAGRPAQTFDALRAALGDVAPGTTVAVTVLRGGAPAEIDVKLGEGTVPARTRVVDVTMRPAADPSPLALEIRRGVFGSWEDRR